MQTKFSTSTNIIRDSGRSLNYIPTPNAVRITAQIGSDFKKGLRSFNIIGSYGTGKSSFLWAIQQSLSGKKRYFDTNFLPNPKVEMINFIGEFKSITAAFAEHFEISSNKNRSENILSEVYQRYHDLGKRNPLLVIVIDEFGKFLEYASQHEPERELYFIQQLCEFANNPEHNILLITTIHQNFDAYAFGLSSTQKQEWTKVKGRFREITFNEPVEQLIFLASEHLSQNQIDRKTENEVRSSLTLLKKSKAFSINAEYASEVVIKLFPLDLFAANILTHSLQKYGQNERSLFSFLESSDHTGLNSFDKASNPFYNASCVYDYLIFNFYSFINSRYNPDFTAWSAIKNSLETVERIFDADITAYAKVVKTIGLLNITSAAGADLGREFLEKYSTLCLGIPNAGALIDNLENRKVILYRNYSKRYILSEGSDLDISSALYEAGNKLSDVVDVVTLLKREYQLPPVIAKAYSYLNGTPRLFEFQISDYPIDEVPTGDLDGFINLVFNEKLSIAELKKQSATQTEAVIYGFYQNSKVIKNQLFEIEKTRKVIDENGHDKIAVKELNNVLLHQRNLLNHYILNNLYTTRSSLVWIYRGEEIRISNKKQFNKYLSQICQQVYYKTPVFKNELVNKHRISSSIHTAKKNYLAALVDNWNKPDLGFEPNKFPPEKTIYLTLLKEPGLNLYSDKLNYVPQVARSSSFSHLWQFSNEFLNSAKKNRKTVAEFMEPLTRKPFKLKQGLIDFWVASFLFIKRDDYALFGESGYIPFLTEEILELVIKYPADYEFKTFDIKGVNLDIFNSYRLFLNQHSKEKFDNQSFIETIKPFLTFYKGLPQYSQTTKRLKKDTLAIRDAIASSKDPEKSFFEDFPMALGFSPDTLQKSPEDLRSFITKLQNSIKELRTSYDGLILRFEEFIWEEFIGQEVGFEEYKQKLQERFKNLKKHLCLPHQKVFIQRLDSQIDDKRAWLSSIAQAILGKPLEQLKDEEEIALKDKFKTLILELDSLTNISQADINEDKEDVFGIEVSSFVQGIQKRFVRLPKTKMNEVEKMELMIKSKLTKDKSINIAAVTNILKELLQ